MTKLPLVLPIIIVIVGGLAATTSAAQETRQHPASNTQATQGSIEPTDARGSSADLRLGLAFWIPVYYAIFVWLLTNNETGGGSKRKVHDRGHRSAALAALGAGGLVPAPVPRPVAAGKRRRNHRRA